MNLEEDHDINCRVILILYQDIDISTEPCLYFGNSHAYVLVRATKGISKIMHYFCSCFALICLAGICLHFYSLFLPWEQMNERQKKDIRQRNNLIWSWTWRNTNVNRIDDNFNK